MAILQWGFGFEIRVPVVGGWDLVDGGLVARIWDFG